MKTKDPSRYDYLRNRPFLVVDVRVRPARGVNTSHKGWYESPNNRDLQEVPEMVDRISDKIMARATVIIDVINNKVIKNRLRRESQSVSPEIMDEQIREHFCDKYASIIAQGKAVWEARTGKN